MAFNKKDYGKFSADAKVSLLKAFKQVFPVGSVEQVAANEIALEEAKKAYDPIYSYIKINENKDGISLPLLVVKIRGVAQAHAKSVHLRKLNDDLDLVEQHAQTYFREAWTSDLMQQFVATQTRADVLENHYDAIVHDSVAKKEYQKTTSEVTSLKGELAQVKMECQRIQSDYQSVCESTAAEKEKAFLEGKVAGYEAASVAAISRPGSASSQRGVLFNKKGRTSKTPAEEAIENFQLRYSRKAVVKAVHDCFCATPNIEQREVLKSLIIKLCGKYYTSMKDILEEFNTKLSSDLYNALMATINSHAEKVEEAKDLKREQEMQKKESQLEAMARMFFQNCYPDNVGSVLLEDHSPRVSVGY